jgi:O-antigen/teichoic acid export membrane protein
MMGGSNGAGRGRDDRSARDDSRPSHREARFRMAITSPPTPIRTRPRTPARLPSRPAGVAFRPVAESPIAPRRIASNFLSLGAAEVACRATSVAVTLSLTNNLGRAGYGRIEFAFNVVFWLVLLVRNGSEVIAARELARHPRLVRPLVNHLFFLKISIAVALFLGLVAVATWSMTEVADRNLLCLYGLMLLTTAMGLDFAYRGMERMGLVAVSLYVRTVVYAVGVSLLVGDSGRIAWVPGCLAAGEACGIALVWAHYVRHYGVPRPRFGGRFLRVFLRRSRPVMLIQVSQTVLGSVDLMVVGLLCPWDQVGLYSAPHRIVTAALTFGMIFQQVVFPALARSWRDTPEAGRRALDVLVRALALGLVPIAVGATVLAQPLVRLLLPANYADASLLLALGIWRAPLLSLAFLYHTTLIALNREMVGVRLLTLGAIGSGPLVILMLGRFGLPGASFAVCAIALLLAVAGYGCLVREHRQPAWHHHLARPLAASAAMIPACLILLQWHVMASVLGGAVVYFLALAGMGGLRRDQLRLLLARG